MSNQDYLMIIVIFLGVLYLVFAYLYGQRKATKQQKFIKYPTLSAFVWSVKVVAWLILVIVIIACIYFAVEMDNYLILLIILPAIINLIYSYIMAESIQVFIDTEENTRKTSDIIQSLKSV